MKFGLDPLEVCLSLNRHHSISNTNIPSILTLAKQMGYDKLCEAVMLLTPHVAVAIVEHRDGYRVYEKARKEIVKMEQDKASFGLLRGAQLVEKAKEYREELGNLHFIIGSFDKLLSFIFPLRDNNSLILALEPNLTELKPLINDVMRIIEKGNLQDSTSELEKL